MAVAARRATALPTLVVVVAGVALSGQAYINGRLGESIGSAEAAAAVNNGVGLAGAAGGHASAIGAIPRALRSLPERASLAPARRPGRRDVHRRRGDRRARDRRGAAERRARLRADDGQPGRRRRRAEPGRAPGRHHGPRRGRGADGRGGRRLGAGRQCAPAVGAARLRPGRRRRQRAAAGGQRAPRAQHRRAALRRHRQLRRRLLRAARGRRDRDGPVAAPRVVGPAAGVHGRAARRRHRDDDGRARLAPGRPAPDPRAHRRAGHRRPGASTSSLPPAARR